MAIRVLSHGLATSVQDLGRPGLLPPGYSMSGGMDRYALRAANLLVGNHEGAAVLEAVSWARGWSSHTMPSLRSLVPNYLQR